MRSLRDYQAESIDQIKKAWHQKLAPLLVLPPGAGKSFTAMSLINEMISLGYFVNLVVRKRDLVEQLESDAQDFGLDYGVYMANHPKFNPTKPLQICSIDTLRSRENYPHVNNRKVINFIDEADESLAKGFQDFINSYKNRISADDNRNCYTLPDALLGGMTATPYNGLHHFDVVVSPESGRATALRDRGLLKDFRYFVPKNSYDLSDVEIKDGEYVREQASTPRDERKALLHDFKYGRFSLLWNVGLFLRGTDIPEIGCILDGAPTLRMNRHEQKLGRGSRINPIYRDCRIIDLAQNCLTLGPYYMDRSSLISLDKPLRLSRDIIEAMELMRRCKECFGAFEPKEFIKGKCPRCGTMNIKPQKKTAFKKMNITELSSEALEASMIFEEFKKLKWQKQNLDRRLDKNTAHRSALISLYRKYGYEKMLLLSSIVTIEKTMLDIWAKNFELEKRAGDIL